jgi:tRNA A37 threonylcarbamoyladenosine synthetase subunit TsaC/SUA5/YrdC
MLVDIRPGNLDQRILDQAASLLMQGKLVAFPTDSSWSVVCDSRSKEGIERLKTLKGTKTFTPTVLTDDLAQWNEFVDLGNAAFRLVKRCVPGPFVFIFPAQTQPEESLRSQTDRSRTETPRPSRSPSSGQDSGPARFRHHGQPPAR